MRYFYSRTKHDPPNSYGDCFSACLSTLLQSKVPHVVHDNPTPDVARRRLDDFLKPLGLAYAEFVIPGQLEFAEVLEWCAFFTAPANLHYILAGETVNGGHYVIGREDQIVHNPSPGVEIVKPFDDGYYWIGLIVKRI